MAAKRRVRVGARRAGARRRNPQRGPGWLPDDRNRPRTMYVRGVLGTGPYDEKIKLPYVDDGDGKEYVHELGETSSIGAASIVYLLVDVEVYGKCILLTHLDNQPLWRRA